METKHTKGEWECKLVNSNASKYWWHIENYLGKSVCNTIDSTSESEANAKLIAAAPDLLEALMKIKDEIYFENSMNEIRGVGKNWSDELNLINNAIKKATE